MRKFVVIFLVLQTIRSTQGNTAEKPSGVSPQSINLPNGPGSIEGLGESFDVSLFSGTAAYGVPLKVPNGSLAPTLRLNYNGGQGNGMVGMGWSLPLPCIARQTDKGLPNYDRNDRLIIQALGINEELKFISGDANDRIRVYQLKVEGPFLRVEWQKAGDKWKIQTKDGKIFWFGQSSQSKQRGIVNDLSPMPVNETYKWCLDKAEDAFGHQAIYNYQQEKGQISPKEITYQIYSSNPDGTFENHIIFDYESRPDRITSYRSRFLVETTKRLSGIRMTQGRQEATRRLLWSYKLEYKNLGAYSVLERIKQIGRDGATALPPLTFQYTESNPALHTLVTMQGRVPDYNYFLAKTATFSDVNADGLPDVVIGDDDNQWSYYINEGGRRFSAHALEPIIQPSMSLQDDNVRVLDANGDSFPDVMLLEGENWGYYAGGDIQSGVLKSFRRRRDIVRSNLPLPYLMTDANVRLVDLDLDRRPDFLVQATEEDLYVVYNRPGSDGSPNDVWDGENWRQGLGPDMNLDDERIQFSDMNADGLLDIVWVDVYPLGGFEDSRVWVWLSKGMGNFEKTARRLKNVPRMQSGRLVDFNGDGLADLVDIGNSSRVSYALNLGQGSFGDLVHIDGLPSMSDVEHIDFADMNGNGTTDVVLMTRDFYYYYLDLLGEQHPYLLKRIDNGLGKVAEITYRSSSEYVSEAQAAGRPWETTLPTPVTVVSQVRISDSLGFEQVVSYGYRDGYFDGPEREFRGFREVTKTVAGTEYCEGRVERSFFNVGDEHEALKGKLVQQRVENSQGQVYSETVSDWKVEELFDEKSFLPLRTSEKVHIIEKGISASRHTKTEWEYDEYGNVLAELKWGEVGADGKNIVGDEVKTLHQYINDRDKWLIGYVKQSDVLELSGEGRQVASSQIYYDNLELGKIARGLVTRKGDWLQDEKQERFVDSVVNQYDEYGNLTKTFDAKGNTRSIFYDPETHTYPEREVIHLDTGDLEVSATYDRGLATVVASWDMNGQQTSYGYDALGRLEWIAKPGDSELQPTVHFTYELGKPTSRIITEQLVDREKGEYRSSWQYMDGLGRKRLAKVQAEAAVQFVATGWVEFCPAGHPVQAFDAYAAPNSELSFPPSGTPFTLKTYDAMGRALKVYPPASEYGNTYALTRYYPLETWVFDEQDTFEQTESYPAITRVDGLGRTREIVKYNTYQDSRTQLTWTVGYSALGKITAIVDPKNNPREYHYDSLGRMTWLVDPNAGRIDYEYDDVGNLTKRVDALGQVRRFVFDQANRMSVSALENSAQGLAPVTYTYHYDHPSGELSSEEQQDAHTQGMLAWVEWPHGSVHYAYDPYGQPNIEIQKLWDPSVEGELKQDSFRRETRYNAAGEIIGETLPGDLHLVHSYNPRGLPLSTWGSIGDWQEMFLASTEYTARGLLKSSQHGNATVTCQKYDDRGQLTAIKTALWSQDVCQNPMTRDADIIQHLNYFRTPTGLISAIRDASPENQSGIRFDADYEYDRLYELTKATTGQETISYAYDSIQNLIQKHSTRPDDEQVAGDWKYGEDGAGPNQVTSAGQERYTYDAIGQMENYRGFDLTFDVAGRMVQATNTEQGTTIHVYYDHGGEQRLKVTEKRGQPPHINRYPFLDYQIRNGSEYWFVKAGAAQAEIKKGDAGPGTPDSVGENGSGSSPYVVRYYHKDHLGGTTQVTGVDGSQVAYSKFSPYGSMADSGGEQPVFGYTGAERDEESDDLGLMRMGARWYAPRLGRWVSADPLTQDPNFLLKRALEANGYSYAGNNPVAFIDLAGLHVGVPVGMRAYNSDTDVRPGDGFTTYTVYKFKTYDYDTYEEYKNASDDERQAKFKAELELSFDVQMNKNKSIVDTKAKDVQLLAYLARFGSPREGKNKSNQFQLRDYRSENLISPNGNNHNIQIHPWGPRGSTGCPTSPLKIYSGRVPTKNKESGLWDISPEQQAFENMMYDAFGLENRKGKNTAVFVIPGKDEEYEWYGKGSPPSDQPIAENTNSGKGP